MLTGPLSEIVVDIVDCVLRKSLKDHVLTAVLALCIFMNNEVCPLFIFPLYTRYVLPSLIH